MYMRRRKNFIIFILLITMIVGISGYVNNVSYSASTTITREKFEDMVLATTYSYLNNKRFSEYDQKAMDAPKSGSLDGTTINWRTYTTTPESANRANFYHVDCSSFAAMVYMHSVNYDFSEYYSKSTSSFYKFNTSSNSFVKSKLSASKANYNEAINYYGKGPSTAFYKAIGKTKKSDSGYYSNNSSTNTNIVVFHYNGNNGAMASAAKTKLKEILRPGDIVVYRRNPSGEEKGHAMIYVGDLIDKNGGFIHATGSDYVVDGDTLSTIGDDDNSVRYDGMYKLDDNLKNYVVAVTVLRPSNKYCTSDSKCSIDSSLVNKLNARVSLLGLRTEQYVRSYNVSVDTNLDKSLKKNLWSTSEYNSVNIGDTLQYTLYLKNNSKIGYCFGNGKYNSESTCEKNGETWKTSTATAKTFKNLIITAKIPTNTTYVSCSGYTCSYDDSTRIVTWYMGSSTLTNGGEKSLRYTVEIDSGNSVKFDGYKIKNSSYELVMDSFTTKVNPTISKINADEMRKNIDKFKDLAASKKIKYTSSGDNVYKIDLDNVSSANVSQYGFVKAIYYNTLGIDIGYLSGSNIKSAIFNVDSSLNFAKKSNSQVNSLTNNNYKNINKMLVKGFYGGRYLRGNDNKDRAGRLRIADLEYGDIIVYFYNNGSVTGNSSMLMYLGTDVNSTTTASENEKNSYFVRFNTDNNVTLYTMNTSKDSYQLFNELYSKDLFVVLRPTQAYGTTVNYSGATISGESLSVEYGTYKNLKSPTSTASYKVTMNYNKSSYTCSNCKASYTGGRTFAGWYSDSSYTNKVSNGSKLAKSTAHTLYTKWNYSTITLPAPTMTGYSLTGWYSDSSLKTKVGNANDNYTINANKTLYGKWEANKYKVKYDSNGGSGIMDTSTYSYDQSYNLAVNKYSKVGYSFSGWSKTKNGTVVYKDGASIKNLTTGTETITLYAVWTKLYANSVVVKINVINGSVDIASKVITKGENVNFTITAKNGYSNPSCSCKNSKISGNKLTISNVSSDVTCEVKFVPKKYSITYNANGGTGTMAKDTYEYGTKYRLTQNKYTKKGYKFLGWSTSVNGIIKYSDMDTISNITSDVVLYAIWRPINYAISYDLNDGIISKKITNYNVETKDFTLPIPTKEGYNFIGWTGSNGDNPQVKVVISKGTTGDKKYVANYEEGVYKVIYKNDSYGSITGIIEEKVKYKNSPSGTTYKSLESYKKLKWVVNKDVRLTDGTVILKNAPITMEQIKNISVESDLIITLYHYLDDKYVVSYQDGNNGTVVGIKSEEVAEKSQPLGTDVRTKAGYEIYYWVANKNVKLTDGVTIVKGSPISDVTKIVINDNVTLTPVYKVGEYVVNYVSDENSIITGSISENIKYPNKLAGTSITVLLEDYQFDYWYSDVDVVLDTNETIIAGEPISVEQLKQIVVASDMSLIAKTKKAYYNVFYIDDSGSNITDTLGEKVQIGGFIKGPEIKENVSNKEVVFKCNRAVQTTTGEIINASEEIGFDKLKNIALTEDIVIEVVFKSNKSNNSFVIVGVLIGIFVIGVICFNKFKNRKSKKNKYINLTK